MPWIACVKCEVTCTIEFLGIIKGSDSIFREWLGELVKLLCCYLNGRKVV